MAESRTTRESKRRALLCVILAVSLCAPRLSAEISAHEREQPGQMRALAAPSSTILVNRGGPRFDHARQRSVVDSPFILVPLSGPNSDGGRSLTAVESALPQWHWAAKAPSGRSPPIAIS
jgi:hypothetical protein